MLFSREFLGCLANVGLLADGALFGDQLYFSLKTSCTSH